MSDTRNAEKNRVEGGTLYLVATPIGNMADLTERAVKVLREADFVAAEDTRNTGRLLQAIGSDRPMVSYHDHNRRERGVEIAARLEGGQSCALVTDAGMPAISDPGEDLVVLCAERGIPVTAVPGACAAVDALALSALSTRRFVFEGFLPTKKSERAAVLDGLKYERRTTVIYEAPHRLADTLGELADALGDRRVALCRELTKLNEEVIRTTLCAAAGLYTDTEPRGEYVLVIEGASESAPADGAWWSDLTVADHVGVYVARGDDKNTAMKKTAADRGLSKNRIYKLLLSGES